MKLKKLSTGYVHISGDGPCEWAQPPRWPCLPEELEESFFPGASELFRHQVRAAFSNEILGTPKEEPR